MLILSSLLKDLVVGDQVGVATAAGTITMVLGHGRLAVANAPPPNVLPAGTDPVCSIGPVVVTDGGGNTILSGTF